MSISVLDSIKNIVSGDSIKIQDEIYTIVSVTDIYLNDYVLIFAELKNTMDEKCFLLFKEYEENEFEFEIFYELEDFPQGKNREEVIEKGFVDLFAPPPDPHDFKPCELYLAMGLSINY